MKHNGKNIRKIVKSRNLKEVDELKLPFECPGEKPLPFGASFTKERLGQWQIFVIKNRTLGFILKLIFEKI